MAGLPYARLPWLAQAVKNLPAIADSGSIPELGRTPGGGNGNPLQYSLLENSVDRGVWRAIVHGVAKESDTTERLKLPPYATCIDFLPGMKSFFQESQSVDHKGYCCLPL